jgi:hypothetical protein
MDSLNGLRQVLNAGDFTFRPVEEPLLAIFEEIRRECQDCGYHNAGIVATGRFNSIQLASVLRIEAIDVATSSSRSGFLTVCALRQEDMVLFPADDLGLGHGEYPPVFEEGDFPLFHLFPSVYEAMNIVFQFPGTHCDLPGWLLFGSPAVCYTALSAEDSLLIGTWRPTA